MKIITYNENTIQLHLINIDKIFRNIQMLILRIDSKTPLLVLFLDSEVYFLFFGRTLHLWFFRKLLSLLCSKIIVLLCMLNPSWCSLLSICFPPSVRQRPAAAAESGQTALP